MTESFITLGALRSYTREGRSLILDYGGPRVAITALTDRMKSVFLEMEDDVPKWNPMFADFMASLGVAPRVCKPYKP